MRRCGDHWICSSCGHNLELDKGLAMETALSIMGDEAPCSAKNMSFAQTAVYIRTLELRWMTDQRRIRHLEQQIRADAVLTFEQRHEWPDGLERMDSQLAAGPPYRS